ncbi:hypothetical protein XF30_13305 [Bradyrhizobium sp. SUTN9-2]|nr:hypothetical protein XF30_13305 [Bradyrhizobium sp. SUTN9-2]
MLICQIDIGKGGSLEPLLVGGLKQATVCLQEGVLEREADLGPGKQLLAALLKSKLAQEPIEKFRGAFGSQHRRPVQDASRWLSFRSWQGLRVARRRRPRHDIRRIQIVLPGDPDQGEQGIPAGICQCCAHPVRCFNIL